MEIIQSVLKVFKKVKWLGCSWLPCTQRDPVERVVDVWKDVEKVGRIELAWGKSQSGFKYQSEGEREGESKNESESEGESESIKVDVGKDVKKVGRVGFA